ncbi:hypothetical protein [Rhodoferax sp.]|uniref:hypothetical protein n=1 Tax=Rhodoferax sp. TaxID=50421 RepID=UPI0019DD57A5|nr:hypothetical protein [Rhodoferax sp.]MBE0474008.1 hypothetical protein [Rhodoferax sp.]
MLELRRHFKLKQIGIGQTGELLGGLDGNPGTQLLRHHQRHQAGSLDDIFLGKTADQIVFVPD